MSIERLLNPRTIAVFGGAQAQEVIRESDRMGYEGKIWPVHPKKTEILGRPVFRSVADLPGSPDAAYIGVNRHLTIDIVRELAERDAGGAICFATGFTEAGEEGSRLGEQLLEASGSMPIIGPNCYGLLNYLNGAMLWPDQQGGRRVSEGVAIITMSSNVGFNLTMQRRGLPIAYMVSLGNRLKFELHDAIHALASEDAVTALGLYLEAIPDPKAFEGAVNFARELGKPIVTIKTGRSDVARKMVVTHTASLAGSDTLVSALFRRLGVARVDSLEALIEALKVLHVLGPLKGGRIAGMSTSGGDLTLLADAMGSRLSMPSLSDTTVERLRATLHERVVPTNPLDYQMFDWNDEDRLAEKFTAFLSEGFDVSLCLLDYPREDVCDQSTWGGAERGFIRAVKETGSKGAVLSTFSDTISEKVAERLLENRIAPLAGIDDGLAGIEAAVEIGQYWSQPPLPPLLDMPRESQRRQTAELNEADAKAFLSKRGIPIPQGRVANSPAEASAAAAEIGFPVVIKALGIAHKTEVGGVRIGLNRLDDVTAAATEMASLSERYLIEKMIEGAVVELIVGIAHDEVFGHNLLLGSGGVFVEMLRDTATLLLPTTKSMILHALNQLGCAPLFEGFRGTPPADVEAAADVILAIAKMVEEVESPILELDVNPLLLLPEGQGVVAADALLRLSSEDSFGD
jgi:acetyl-CoA synthetase